MADEDGSEVGIALGGKYRERMSDDPKHDAGQPHLQAETQRGRDRAVDDGDGARGAAQQDWFGERTVQRDFEAFDIALHQTSAPPPKEKKERKKLDAAKAIEMPKTIWIRRRKPPEVSPNASVRPVTMMMSTAMILATGPWTESSTCWSGCSHGMLVPDAQAGRHTISASIAPVMAVRTAEAR